MLWLTRSEPGATRQAQELNARGYQTLVAPVLTIEPTGNPAPVEPADLVIFLSEHALECAADLVFTAEAAVFAVGTRTQAALAAEGISAQVPEQHSSEGLLQLPELQAVAGVRVVLVTGEGGRDLLAETLNRRGAEVCVYRSYRRRALTRVEPAVKNVSAIVVASGDGMQAVAVLWRGMGGRSDVPVLVPSARVAEIAAQLQFTCVIECAGADSHAILSGLKQIAVS